MIRSVTAFALTAAMLGTAFANDEAVENLKPYPAADKGMTRYVIILPHVERADENEFKVELFVGKTMLTDGVNRASMGGSIEDGTVKGWGYTFYRVDELGPVRQTLIGVPPGTPKVKTFVSMPSRLIRYNSRLPIVVYVPEGAEVRYRIWTAADKTESAEQG